MVLDWVESLQTGGSSQTVPIQEEPTKPPQVEEDHSISILSPTHPGFIFVLADEIHLLLNPNKALIQVDKV